jgi:hypothetical protein
MGRFSVSYPIDKNKPDAEPILKRVQHKAQHDRVGDSFILRQINGIFTEEEFGEGEEMVGAVGFEPTTSCV